MLTALIMAGGSGERFWPLSTSSKPKQLLNLFSDKTMIRETMERILPIISPDKIFIATNILHAIEIKKELPEIPEENIVVEPLFKDTAVAIGYTSMIIEERFKSILSKNEKLEVVVLASDHLIKKSDEFRKIIKIAGEEASKNSVIVTLGIKPNKPETAYGYIELQNDEEIILNQIYKVKRFREKPNYETAQGYLESGNFLWNSGMFIFTTETIFKNFEVSMESHTKLFNELRKEIQKKKIGEDLSELVKPYFEKFEKISIDYGIMESSKNIRVIPVDIEWNDIGSFSALEEIFVPDKNGNIIKGIEVSGLDFKNNIVIGSDIKISLLGVEDLIIVKNGENLLIAKKNRAQDIKKISEKNKEN
ncbi:MAG: mannose-1-phosphate guanylyltransferase [Fusobacteriaceae bacterium]